MKNLNDVQLIKLLFNGNEKALNEVYRRYKPRLLAHILFRTRDLEISKDLLQESFIKIWEIKNDIEAPTSLISFLTTMVNRMILDHYKSAKVRNKHLEHITHDCWSIDNSDHLIRNKEQSEKIKKAINNLPKTMRAVFVMCRIKKMTRQQISKQINMPENSIKSNVQRAIARLRKELDYHI